MKTCEYRLFEYHCYEGEDSSDAELWHRTHRPVIVLAVAEPGGGDTPEERAENGMPRVYKIRFGDGFTSAAFEDELLTNTNQFERPDYAP